MKSVNRTANCIKCGSVNLKLRSGVGDIFYYCADCGSDIGEVKQEKYETTPPICEYCDNDIFKVWITVDNDKEIEYWEPKCTNCNITPKKICVNNEGNEIDEKQREILLLKDNVKKLKDEINENKSIINELKSQINELDYKIEEKDMQIESLKEEIEEADRKIYNLVLKIEELSYE